MEQPGIGPTGQELAVGNESNNTLARSIIRLEQFPYRLAPECHRKFRKRVKLAALACRPDWLFQIVPQPIHPVPDQRLVLAFLRPPLRRVADDREHRLFALDAVGLPRLS